MIINFKKLISFTECDDLLNFTLIFMMLLWNIPYYSHQIK